jgi:hypothetical protein
MKILQLMAQGGPSQCGSHVRSWRKLTRIPGASVDLN